MKFFRKGKGKSVSGMKISSARKKYFALRSRNGGFTLAEMLLTFSFFLLLLAFFPMGMDFLLQEGLSRKGVQKMEWEVFLSQAKKELRMCDKVLSTENGLSFTMNEQMITYKMFGSNLRRQVNERGHELILQEVKAASFERIKQGVKITVEDTFGTVYSAVIRMPLREEVP